MITRRRFLQASAGAGAALTLPGLTGCGDADDGAARETTTTSQPPKERPGAFTHGVASGDPHADSVVLWTRVDAGLRDRVDLRWEVASDDTFGEVLASGRTSTDASRDWTTKVIAAGLGAGTTYAYRFVDAERPGGAAASPTGRTRTAPDGDVDQLRFGVVSCSNYGYGYFHAYRHLLERDLDAVVHLGDYIYEYANEGKGETYGTVRTLDPETEVTTLDGYRRRYAHYRSDPDLAELHRRHPMIHVWDDHEFADDPTMGGAANHQPEDGDWNDRIAAALQAYDEWLPTRLDGNRIYRVLDYGPLARIIGLDRQRRFLWPDPDDGDRYLGAAQADWLDEQLGRSPARWSVLAQQTTFAPVSHDARSGGWPTADRSRALTAASKAETDVVVLTGDIHRFHAIDVVDDPEAWAADATAGIVAVEFAVGSITSPGSDALGVGRQVRGNSGLVRGYSVVTLTPDQVRCDNWGFDDIHLTERSLPEERWLAGFTSNAGRPQLLEADGPS